MEGKKSTGSERTIYWICERADSGLFAQELEGIGWERFFQEGLNEEGDSILMQQGVVVRWMEGMVFCATVRFCKKVLASREKEFLRGRGFL